VHALGRVQRDTLHEATHDQLTGLPNRVFLDRWLVAELARRRSLTLLYLDLDGFKLVNDSFGHASGDELLGAVAERLRTLTPPGAVLSRLGGDEFVITYAAPGPNPHALAAHVLATIRQPFALAVSRVVVTGSIGIAVSGPTTSAQDLLREADTAMYRAKVAGRGVVATYDDSMRGSVRERLELEQALRQAMALGQLTVEFQPVVDLGSGRVESHEALLRWLHPIRGEVPTEAFITLAEEAGLLNEIGDWVLDEALRAVAHRRADGDSGLTVAVNVAGRQLADPMLTERVTAALRRHRLPPTALKLEITESAMMQDDVFVAETVTALFDAGVLLSMDDFGTGFSSLSYLRQLPVCEVKIDRSFVAGIVDSPADEEIVRAATAMAHALRLRVVAEGVETVGQRDMLLRLGVDHGQGWLFGRPEPFFAAIDMRSRVPVMPTAGRHPAS
jgi:diguanylate cyclase (GGDEF)-like protein